MRDEIRKFFDKGKRKVVKLGQKRYGKTVMETCRWIFAFFKVSQREHESIM